MTRITLNAIERQQLGTERNAIPFIPTLDEWNQFRAFLVKQSTRRNPGFFDPQLAAYTPGETEALLNNPQIQTWHHNVQRFRVPENTELIVLVPCAASKPWRDSPNLSRSKLYRAYNRIAAEIADGADDLPKAYFMTVSEPLGIVPEAHWRAFPPYDNPGLFSDDFLRTGLVKSAWTHTFLKKKHRLPFDPEAAQRCIQRLGQIIGQVLVENPLPVLAMVDQTGTETTHAAMVNEAITLHPELAERIERVSKRAVPRVDPYDYIRETIAGQKPSTPNKRPRRRIQ